MTATDLPVKPRSALHLDNPPVFDSRLDNSFADINWQAPWLRHLNQLNYISETVKSLSSLSQQADNLAEYDDEADLVVFDVVRPDIVAKVLNTALQQQADDLQQHLPQTKPVHNNQAHTLKFVPPHTRLNQTPLPIKINERLANTRVSCD